MQNSELINLIEKLGLTALLSGYELKNSAPVCKLPCPGFV